jgi:formylglycine-generating enzyme required for sulfatase activity
LRRALVLFAAPLALAACFPSVDYGDTHYQCPDQRCPSGFTCVADECVRGGPGPDAQPGPDAPPGEHDAGAPAALFSVPAGDFYRGCDITMDPTCPIDTLPAGQVTLSAYQIDEHEVTRGAYQDCVTAGACVAPAGFSPAGNEALPVGGVSWDQAVAYCAWIGRRLPTEAEWERAARGVDGRTYPWGEPAPDCARATFAGCGDPVAVGSHAADQSPIGATELAGNVSEWIADWYQPGYLGGTVDPTGPANGTQRGVRGGGADSPATLLRTYARDKAAPALTSPTRGFRCAK